jgi:hypothetical protein
VSAAGKHELPSPESMKTWRLRAGDRAGAFGQMRVLAERGPR